jgi:hypothetical protein
LQLTSPRGDAPALAGERAAREIDHGPAFAAFMGPIEFVGKNLLLGPALLAVAGKRFQTLEIGVTRAMLGGSFLVGHGIPPRLKLSVHAFSF